MDNRTLTIANQVLWKWLEKAVREGGFKARAIARLKIDGGHLSIVLEHTSHIFVTSLDNLTNLTILINLTCLQEEQYRYYDDRGYQ